jgi:hypothetical protein
VRETEKEEMRKMTHKEEEEGEEMRLIRRGVSMLSMLRNLAGVSTSDARSTWGSIGSRITSCGTTP